jgi:hypothetical protein
LALRANKKCFSWRPWRPWRFVLFLQFSFLNRPLAALAQGREGREGRRKDIFFGGRRWQTLEDPSSLTPRDDRGKGVGMTLLPMSFRCASERAV